MLLDPLTALAVHQQHVNPVLGWSADCEVLEYQAHGSTDDQRFRNVRNGEFDPELKSTFPDWTPDSVTLLGCSGWCPVDLVSVWGGIDLDSAANHDKGLTPERLAEYVAAISKLPYCQVQRSKSGSGIHVFGRFGERPSASTRSDHKRNVKRFALRIEQDTGLPLLSDADVYGGNLWLWWTQRGQNSFQVISEATQPIPDDLPELPPPPPARNTVDVTEWDDRHKAIIEAAAMSGYAVAAARDSKGQPFLNLHTRALTGLNTVGTYRTVSTGRDPRTPNACAYPVADGGLLVCRYGNTKECEPWFESAAGNWVCLFNVPQDVATVAARHGVKKHRGDLVGTVQELSDVLREANGTQVDTSGIGDRSATLSRDGGQWTLATAWKQSDGIPPAGWHWPPGSRCIVFMVDAPTVSDADPRITSQAVYVIIGDADADGIRDAENFVRVENGELVQYTEPKLDHALKQDGLKRDQRDHVKLSAPRLRRRVKHFQPLIDVDGGWLNSGAKLKPHSDTPGEHPTWDTIDGIFDVLTPHLPEWYAVNGIVRGGLVARLWTALMIREHDHALPMLALFSKQQGTGKTWWAQSRKMLFTGGQAFANGVLSRGSQFNAHVLRSVFAHIEECDVRECYDQIKPLISDDQVESEAKHVQATVADNRCHFVQTTNRLEYIPMDPDDTRIIVVPVKPLQTVIGKRDLERRLTEERPAYLHTLLTMPLPDPAPGIGGRLWLPIIHTPERQLLMDLHDPVSRFVRDYCKAGGKIPSTEFGMRFNRWLSDVMDQTWTPSRIHKRLPDGVTYRNGSGNTGEIVGVTWA